MPRRKLSRREALRITLHAGAAPLLIPRTHGREITDSTPDLVIPKFSDSEGTQDLTALHDGDPNTGVEYEG